MWLAELSRFHIPSLWAGKPPLLFSRLGYSKYNTGSASWPPIRQEPERGSPRPDLQLSVTTASTFVSALQVKANIPFQTLQLGSPGAYHTHISGACTILILPITWLPCSLKGATWILPAHTASVYAIPYFSGIVACTALKICALHLSDNLVNVSYQDSAVAGGLPKDVDFNTWKGLTRIPI